MSIRHNRFLNPDCVSSGNGPTLTYDLDNLTWAWNSRHGFALISKTNSIGAFAEFRSAPLEAGRQYVFRVEVGYPHKAQARGAIVSISDAAGKDLAAIGDRAPAQRVQELRFTATDDRYVILKFRGVNTNTAESYDSIRATAFYEPQLELAETFDQAKTQGGLLFFSGSTYPSGGA